MFSEILRIVIFFEIIAFIFLIINTLFFVYTQSFISIISLILNLFTIAFGFVYLYIEYLRW